MILLMIIRTCLLGLDCFSSCLCFVSVDLSWILVNSAVCVQLMIREYVFLSYYPKNKL